MQTKPSDFWKDVFLRRQERIDGARVVDDLQRDDGAVGGAA